MHLTTLIILLLPIGVPILAALAPAPAPAPANHVRDSSVTTCELQEDHDQQRGIAARWHLRKPDDDQQHRRADAAARWQLGSNSEAAEHNLNDGAGIAPDSGFQYIPDSEYMSCDVDSRDLYLRDECPADFDVARWCTQDAKKICDGTCEGTDCDGQYCEQCYECDAPGW